MAFGRRFFSRKKPSHTPNARETGPWGDEAADSADSEISKWYSGSKGGRNDQTKTSAYQKSLTMIKTLESIQGFYQKGENGVWDQDKVLQAMEAATESLRVMQEKESILSNGPKEAKKAKKGKTRSRVVHTIRQLSPSTCLGGLLRRLGKSKFRDVAVEIDTTQAGDQVRHRRVSELDTRGLPIICELESPLAPAELHSPPAYGSVWESAERATYFPAGNTVRRRGAVREGSVDNETSTSIRNPPSPQKFRCYGNAFEAVPPLTQRCYRPALGRRFVEVPPTPSRRSHDGLEGSSSVSQDASSPMQGFSYFEDAFLQEITPENEDLDITAPQNPLGRSKIDGDETRDFYHMDDNLVASNASSKDSIQSPNSGKRLGRPKRRKRPKRNSANRTSPPEMQLTRHEASPNHRPSIATTESLLPHQPPSSESIQLRKHAIDAGVSPHAVEYAPNLAMFPHLRNLQGPNTMPLNTHVSPSGLSSHAVTPSFQSATPPTISIQIFVQTSSGTSPSSAMSVEASPPSPASSPASSQTSGNDVNMSKSYQTQPDLPRHANQFPCGHEQCDRTFLRAGERK